MFTAADDATLGIPVVNESYPDGEAGIQKSLAVICKKVREGAATAVMKSYAGNVLKQAGFPKSNAERAAAFLDHVRSNVAYAHDALGTEQIQSAAVSLCVDGAPICIPIGDCFPEGTLLLRRDGQLVPIEEIRVGDEIWGSTKWTRIEAKVFKGRLKVDAIEMNNGSTMYLTPDHHVYVGRCKHDRGAECPTCRSEDRDAGGYERIRVSDLVEGAALLQPERIAFGNNISHDGTMYVTALALADGWAEPEQARFKIAGKDGHRKEAQKREVQEICAKLGIETHWHRRYITVKSRPWAEKIGQLGHVARFKRLPTLDLDKGAAAEALRGLMADSTANTNGPGRTYSTTSHALMVQVRVLHRMFGRSTSVKMLTPEQHRGAGKHPLWRVGIRETVRAEKTLLVRSIERAVRKVPCWDIQTDDHKVYLPEHDVTVSQCDDLVTALATLCGAAGLEVEIVRQFFGPGHQQHVLCEVKLEDGMWCPLDPSSQVMPAGTKARAMKETRCSPWDESVTGFSGDAQFVGIGALPVFLWQSEKGWRQVQTFQGLGAEEKRWYPVGSGVEAPLPAGRVMLWEGGWWYRDPATGQAYQWTCCEGCAHGKPCAGAAGLARIEPQTLGAITLDASMLSALSLDPRAWLRKFWQFIDLRGRTWDQALLEATGRAIAKNWLPKDLDTKADFLTLLLSSALNAKMISSASPEDTRASDALNRTWVVIARRMGIDPRQVDTEKMKSSATAEIAPGIMILLLIIGAALIAAIYVALFYFGSKVIDDVLSKIECDRELVRLHAEYNKVVDRHLENPGQPWTPEEKALVERLEKEQEYVAGGCTKPKPEPSWWPLAIAAGVVGITVLGVAYAPEIKDYFAKRRAR